MKRVLIIILAAVMVMTLGATPAAAKAIKGQRVKCPYCIDGRHIECPYTVNGHHMTPGEIQDFEIMEMGLDPVGMSQREKNHTTPWFTVGGKTK